MRRCLELAKLGKGKVAPNPMVGAVLVYEGKIIGEGYHECYGQAHAEVNCINSVMEVNKHLISLSTIYVSLEPCAHFGKTPPCCDLIVQKQIRRAVIGCRDPFKQVDGRGIEGLKQAGVEVVLGVLEGECIELNKFFFTFHQQQRPYIILKWAQTANKKIAVQANERLRISNEYTDRLVHQWRSSVAAILVGTNTALFDNPHLNNRLWHGNDPIRFIIDLDLKLPRSLHIFDETQKTIIFNTLKQEDLGNTLFYKLLADQELIDRLLKAFFQLNIQSVLVEGGAKLLQSFIDAGKWDEAHIITNKGLTVEEGLAAPALTQYYFIREQYIFSDNIQYFKHN